MAAECVLNRSKTVRELRATDLKLNAVIYMMLDIVTEGDV